LREGGRVKEIDACLLARFPGTRPPDWLRRWLDDGLGGVLLFAENITSPAQLADGSYLGTRGAGRANLAAADVLLGRTGTEGACRDGPPRRGSPGVPSS
jgi:hypothetical protein